MFALLAIHKAANKDATNQLIHLVWSQRYCRMRFFFQFPGPKTSRPKNRPRTVELKADCIVAPKRKVSTCIHLCSNYMLDSQRNWRTNCSVRSLDWAIRLLTGYRPYLSSLRRPSHHVIEESTSFGRPSTLLSRIFFALSCYIWILRNFSFEKKESFIEFYWEKSI